MKESKGKGSMLFVTGFHFVKDYISEFIKKRRYFTHDEIIDLVQKFDKLNAKKVNYKSNMGTEIYLEK